LPNEDKKLDNLRPGSREMERGRCEGQTFQPLKEVHRLEEEENITQKRKHYSKKKSKVLSF